MKKVSSTTTASGAHATILSYLGADPCMLISCAHAPHQNSRAMLINNFSPYISFINFEIFEARPFSKFSYSRS